MQRTEPTAEALAISAVRVNRIMAVRRAAPSEEYSRRSETIAAGHPFARLAANDEFEHHELPTVIPPGKLRQSAELAKLIEGLPVTVCPPRKVRTSIAPWKPARAANDNQAPLSWPLAEALRRSGRADDIEVCEIYRGLYSVMAAEPLQGKEANLSEKEEPGIDIEHRSTLDGYAEFKDSGDVVGTGEIEYKGVRRTARTPGVSAKANSVADGQPANRYRVTTSRFNETTMITQIDMRRIWKDLRAAIRPVLPAFEDACLDGMTMTEIGTARGYLGKPASAVGKALVFAAIDTLTEEWHAIQRYERALAEQAERNVVRFRAKLARRDAVYLGLAA